MKIIPKFQNSGKLPSKDNKELKRELIIINPNDEFLYHRDFADVYKDSLGRRYSVYTEDNSLPTVTSNRARRNLEKPLWEHILKQYARNPRGMKTIEDAVTWGGNVAGASALAVGTAPIWLPYVAPAANTLGKVGKLTLLGLDWLFNPTTYRGALLSSYVGAEGINNFRKNPNIETGALAALGLLPVIPAAINGARSSKIIQTVPKTIKLKYVAPYMASRILNRSINANPKGQILVSDSYFNNPNNWYRITNTPEVYGIKEVGRNVTTRDSGILVDVPSDNWRTSVLELPLIRDKEGFLMLDPNRHNRSPQLFLKTGSAHGNTSQASKGLIWQDGVSNSSMFPTVILEGLSARQVPMGITRTNFKLTPWEDIPMGLRIGFHTGEMPLDNLRYFLKLGNGKYSYQGTIIPDKRINAENY